MEITEADIRRVIDREAIRESLLRYTRGLDRHDNDIVARAYHPDANDDHGQYIGGRDGLIRHCQEANARLWKAHTHYLSNETIEIDKDTAHVESYFFVTLLRDNGIIDAVGGRYVDRFERREGEWAIADRVVVLEWNGEINKTTLAIDPELYVRGRWDTGDLSYQRPLKVARQHREIQV